MKPTNFRAYPVHFLLLLWSSLFYSCTEDLINAENNRLPKRDISLGFHKYNWSDSELEFFALNSHNQNIITSRSSVIRYHPLLIEAYNQMADANENEPFVDSLVLLLGYPDWESSQIYQDTQMINGFLLIPFSFPNSDSISGVVFLSAKNISNRTDFVINGFSKAALFNLNSGNAHQKHEIIKYIINYERNYFNRESPGLLDLYCENKELRSGQPEPSGTGNENCVWELIELCEYLGYQYFGGTPNLPIHLDHDRDGIPNEEDRDWDDFKNRYNISQEIFEEFIYDVWETQFEQQYGEYFHFWDSYYEIFYEDIWEHGYDAWDDYINSELYDEFFDELYESIYEEWENSIEIVPHFPPAMTEWDEEEWGYDCGWGFVGNLESRTLICNWYYVLNCGNPGDFSQDLLLAFDEVIPCTNCTGDADEMMEVRANEYALHFRLDEFAPLLINYSDCPVFVPSQITYDCFTEYLIDIYVQTYQLNIPNNLRDWIEDNPYVVSHMFKMQNEYPILDDIYVLDAVKNFSNITFQDFYSSYDVFLAVADPSEPTEPEVYENGIEIISAYAPLSWQTGTYLGQNEDRNNIEDLEYSVSPNYNSVIMPFIKEATDAELFNHMNSMMVAFTLFDQFGMLPVAEQFVDVFEHNTSTIYVHENYALSEKVVNSVEMQNFVKLFGARLNIELQNNNGNIENVNVELPLSERPQFNTFWDALHGLRILLNDTEHTTIFIQDYNYDPQTGIWTAELIFNVLDHFGLNERDVIKFAWLHPGFQAWYALQKNRGYVPFQTRIQGEFIIRGDITP